MGQLFSAVLQLWSFSTKAVYLCRPHTMDRVWPALPNISDADDKKRFEQLPAHLQARLWDLMPVLDSFQPECRDLVALEIMAGNGEITSAVNNHGPCMPFDLCYETGMDILTDRGFSMLVRLALRVKPSGTCWMAPCCSTWIWIGRRGTGRTSTNPEGNETVARTCNSNIMVERCVVIAVLLYTRGVHIAIEQPHGSLMWLYNPMEEQ
jgi:hypothetical protein